MILRGIKGLLSSRKGTLSLIIVALCGVANLTGHLGGPELVGCLTVVSSIFMWMHTTSTVSLGDSHE